MHQESNCVHGMTEEWYAAQRMKNLEHDQCFWIQMLFNEKPNTTTTFSCS